MNQRGRLLWRPIFRGRLDDVPGSGVLAVVVDEAWWESARVARLQDAARKGFLRLGQSALFSSGYSLLVEDADHLLEVLHRAAFHV